MYSGERFNGYSHLAGALLALAGASVLVTLAAMKADALRGWTLFGLVWALAAIGIVQEFWIARGARLASLAIYVIMGWLALVALVPSCSPEAVRASAPSLRSSRRTRGARQAL